MLALVPTEKKAEDEFHNVNQSPPHVIMTLLVFGHASLGHYLLNISFSSPPRQFLVPASFGHYARTQTINRRLGTSLFARTQRNWFLCWSSLSLARQTACSEIVTVLNYSLYCKTAKEPCYRREKQRSPDAIFRTIY